MTLMLLGFTVIVDAYQQQTVSILSHLGRVLLAQNLGDSRVGILVILQFDDDGGRVDILTGNQHQIGKALARGQLSISCTLETSIAYVDIIAHT